MKTFIKEGNPFPPATAICPEVIEWDSKHRRDIKEPRVGVGCPIHPSRVDGLGDNTYTTTGLLDGIRKPTSLASTKIQSI